MNQKCKTCGGGTHIELDRRSVYPHNDPKREDFLSCNGCDLPVEKCICLEKKCPLCNQAKRNCICDEW